MMQRKIRDRVPYTWALAQALDRVAQARGKIQAGLTRGEYRFALAGFRSAASSLYMILPRKVRESVGRPPRGLEELEEWVSRVVDELDRMGLLIDVKNEPVGGEIVDIGVDQ